jgi:hypothetical protein
VPEEANFPKVEEMKRKNSLKIEIAQIKKG